LHDQDQVLRLLYNTEIEPDNATVNGNYAQFLFIKGEESQAQVYLDKAFNFADNHQDLLAAAQYWQKNPTLLTLHPFSTTHPIVLSPAVDNQDNVPNDKTIIQPIDLDDCQQN
jgi:hypothetical protein